MLLSSSLALALGSWVTSSSRRKSAHIHYFPVQWMGEAHTYSVMAELDMLFRYTAMYLIGKEFR